MGEGPKLHVHRARWVRDRRGSASYMATVMREALLGKVKVSQPQEVANSGCWPLKCLISSGTTYTQVYGGLFCR